MFPAIGFLSRSVVTTLPDSFGIDCGVIAAIPATNISRHSASNQFAIIQAVLLTYRTFDRLPRGYNAVTWQFHGIFNLLNNVLPFFLLNNSEHVLPPCRSELLLFLELLLIRIHHDTQLFTQIALVFFLLF